MRTYQILKLTLYAAIVAAVACIVAAFLTEPHKYTFMRWNGDTRIVLTVKTDGQRPVDIEDSEGSQWHLVK
jgi:hypothetical protein